MKLKWIVILLLLASVLGLAWYQQWKKGVQQKAKIATLERTLQQKAEHLEDLQARKEQINRQRAELLTQAERQAIELRQQEAAAARLAKAVSPQPAGGDKSNGADGEFGKLLSKMMEDPQTKKFIREQQRMVMDQLYAPLIKQLDLKPDDANKFKELLADTAMRGAERATSLFGSGSETNRADAMTALSDEVKSDDAKVKELLGETGYAQYKDYQMTVGERMQLNLFRQQLGGGEAALTDPQTEQLLVMMKEEKENSLAAGQAVFTPSQDPATIQAMLTDDQTDRFIQTQEGVNDRVYERAKTVLSPKQLEAFSRFQTNQLQMMRLGVSMARKFMGGAKSVPAP